MRRWPVWLAAVLVAVVTLVPLARSHPVPLAVGVPVGVGLAAAGALSAWSGRLRVLLPLVVVAWTAVLLLFGHGSAEPAIGIGVAVRLWVGLPELVLLGRSYGRDLLAEVLGGGCAAALVVYVGTAPDALAPSRLLLAVAAGVVLVAAASRRLRS